MDRPGERRVPAWTLHAFVLAVAVLTLALMGATRADAAIPAAPGGPILVITGNDPANQFGSYYAEILRAEGLNEFDVASLSSVTSSTLAAHDVAILADTPVDVPQRDMLAAWVQGGGNLIAMHPDVKLAGLLGLANPGGSLDDAYIKVQTGSAPGAGITAATMQFHGSADRYDLTAGTTAVASLADSVSPIANPAVTLRDVGSNGGQAAAFTYDLARSVVYTRQGNPLWINQNRDGEGGPTTRSDDLFYGNASFDHQTDWVNLDKVAIPQADEQQRLLANLIETMNADRSPLPRFWYLPNGKKAAVVMTGDDHGNGGTAGRFDKYIAVSPAKCSDPATAAAAIANWECVRGTSYVYPGTSVPGATSYQSKGFEVALHYTTGCTAWSGADTAGFPAQLDQFANAYPGIDTPTTNRTHCIAWGGWMDPVKVEQANGVRLDTNYYYWPGTWVQDRPGMFTGSGMPMRFADVDGSLSDVFQAATQITDESNMPGEDQGTYAAASIQSLLDKAIGSEGYYGAFTMNMHTDSASSSGSDAIVAAAQARGVPVVSARQMLTWLDGRDASKFTNLHYSAGAKTLSFDIAQGTGATGLQSMIPTRFSGLELKTITRNGGSVTPASTRTVKGVEYAFVDAASGSYVATYGDPTPPPPPPSYLTDTTTTDFSSGTGSAYVSSMADGELTLPATSATEFPGTTLPSGWYQPVPWSQYGFNGTATVAGGSLLVDGARVGTDLTYGPSHSLEFAARFQAQTFQHMGFAVDYDSNATWAMFSTDNDGNDVHARVRNGGGGDLVNVIVKNPVTGASLVDGTVHRYRIDVTPTGVNFYVDGVLAPGTANAVVMPALAVVASSLRNTGNPLTIDWVRISPYTSPATFVSRVMDAGSVVDWDSASWIAGTPAGTGLTIEVRTGSTSDPADPAGHWTSYRTISSGDPLTEANSRYIRYRATLTTSDTAITPVLQQISFAFTHDTVAPTTTITGPSSVTSSSAPFSFSANEAVSGYECWVDSATPAACSSPFTASGLTDGAHTFHVRATDLAGNVESPAASKAFTVDTTPADTTPPDTVIDSGPSGLTALASASFTFHATEAGSTFECRIDSTSSSDWASCASGKSYSSLADGSHTFEVRATDAAHNTDASPATRTFTVDTTKPDTIVDSGTTSGSDATFAFHATESGSTFECALDGGTPAPCTSPKLYSSLADGAHTLSVRAIDAAGNADPSPATKTVTVSTPGGGAMDITFQRPWQGARYSAYANPKPELTAAYACTGAVTCTASVDGSPIAPGAAFPRPNPSPSASIAKTFTVTATDGSGHTLTRSVTYRVYTFASLVQDSSPLAYWRLGDVSGASVLHALTGQAGEYKNGQDSTPWGISGDGDAARRFTGADGYAYVNGITAPRNYTMSVFFRLDDAARSAMIMQHGGAGAIWYDTTAGVLRFRPVDWDGVTLSSPAVSAGTWHHVAGSFGAGTARLYLDGTEVDVADSQRQTSGTSTLYLGYGDKAPWLRGALDEAAYFAQALSVDEVHQIWLADPPPAGAASAPASDPAPAPAPSSGGATSGGSSSGGSSSGGSSSGGSSSGGADSGASAAAAPSAAQPAAASAPIDAPAPTADPAPALAIQSTPTTPTAAPAVKVARAAVRNGVLRLTLRCAARCSGSVTVTVAIGGKTITLGTAMFSGTGNPVAAVRLTKAGRKALANPKHGALTVRIRR